MFTFHWSELVVIVVGGLLLFFGLALLMLRRRNEVLQIFLTPEEPGLEEEFFRVRQVTRTESVPEEDIDGSEMSGSEETEGEDAVRWGTSAEGH